MKVNDIVVLKNASSGRNKILELSKHLFRIVAKDKQNLRLESLETGVMIIIVHECVRLATLKERYLVDGNVVELENGDVYVVVNNFIVNIHHHGSLTNYNENMEQVNFKELGIKKVYQFINPVYHYSYSSIEVMLDLNYEGHKVIWQRRIELTDDEKVILRNLDDEYKYINRRESGSLLITSEKGSVFGHSHYINIYNHLFKSITYESGVHEIKELLK